MYIWNWWSSWFQHTHFWSCWSTWCQHTHFYIKRLWRVLRRGIWNTARDIIKVITLWSLTSNEDSAYRLFWWKQIIWKKTCKIRISLECKKNTNIKCGQQRSSWWFGSIYTERFTSDNQFLASKIFIGLFNNSTSK